MFWRRKVRSFEVLGERFALPSLDLADHLDRAARLRSRLGATWFEGLVEPLIAPLRKPERRARLAFVRAHRVLSAHESIIFAALDHVAIYDDALARATHHVGDRSRTKVDELLGKAAERRRIADKAAHLASRVEDQLEADLALIAERIRLVGKAAHLMLLRLQRYRSFVKRTSSALTRREAELTAQRTLLVHDEHTFELSRELANDREIERWLAGPDAICAGIEQTLRAMVTDLEGLEGGVAAVPEAVEKLLASADGPEGGFVLSGLDEFASAMQLPPMAEVPERLDDEDWEALEAHELESEVVFTARSVEALGVEVLDWLVTHGGAKRDRVRACAMCGGAIVSGAALGRAHVLCVGCREKAEHGGHAWLERCGFAPIRDSGSRRYESPVTRLVFESVMGWVPSAGPAREAVTQVTWHEAILFCNALSRREGRRPAYRVRGDRVSLRGGEVGWRLVDARTSAKGPLREWRWGRVDDPMRAVETLKHGLRPIAVPGADTLDRAVPEEREGDLTFRVTCEFSAQPPHVPADHTSRKRVPKTRSPSPMTTRPDPVGGRRVMQALSLGMLVSGAAVAVAIEATPVSYPAAPPAAPAQETTSPPPVAEPIAASGEPIEPGDPRVPTPAADPRPPDDSALSTWNKLMQEGLALRKKRDRVGARRAFDQAVVVAPDDLVSRYESAREAAYARDLDQAFLHLEVVAKRAATTPEGQRLLLDARRQTDFSRLRRDPRWKVIDTSIR